MSDPADSASPVTPAPVVHINGYPGSGKRTVGAAVADALGGRLIDNHLVLDPAFALFPLGSPEWSDLADDLRDLVHAAARKVPADTALVFTDILYDGFPSDARVLARVASIAADRGSAFLSVTLRVDEAEHERRLRDPSRGRNKLTDWELGRRVRDWNALLVPDTEDVLDLDSTGLTVDGSKDRILEALACLPASDSPRDAPTGSVPSPDADIRREGR